MHHLPKISVVTPSFNQGQYIEQTICSILGQDYPNIEYIIYDGGSKDDTIEIVKRYENRIAYWESKKDEGQADAILKGFNKATGDIICWVNSDDYLLPGCLTYVARFFSEHPNEICLVGSSVIVDERSKPIYHNNVIPSFTVGSTITYDKLLYYGCSFNQSSSFFRRDIFFEVNGFDKSLQFCFDYDLFLRMSKTKPFSYTDRFLSAFRLHNLSKSTQIQEVCKMENAILWERNGRNEKSKISVYLRKVYYSLENYILKYFKLLRHYVLFRNALGSLNHNINNAKK